MENHELLTPDNLARENKPLGDRYRIGQEVFANSKVRPSRNPGNWIDRAISSMRHANPIMPYAADLLPWTLYDRFSLTNGATSARKYQFFVVQQGQASKTKVDTNMERAGELASPQVFNATHIGFYPESTALRADIDAVLRDYYVEFKIGGKVYAEGKPMQFPGGAGLDAFTTKNSESAYKIGVPIAGNMWDLRLPPGMQLEDSGGTPFITDGIIGQVITEGEQFEVNLISDSTFTVASAPFNLYCFLTGILSRGVR